MTDNTFQYIKEYFGANGKVNSVVLGRFYDSIEANKRDILEMVRLNYLKVSPLLTIEFHETFIDESQLSYKIKTKDFPSKVVLQALECDEKTSIFTQDTFLDMPMNDMLSQTNSLKSFMNNSLLTQPKDIRLYTTEYLMDVNNIWFFIERNINFLDTIRKRMDKERTESEILLLNRFSINVEKNRFILEVAQELIEYHKNITQNSIGIQKAIDVLINQHLKRAFDILKSDYKDYLDNVILRQMSSIFESKNIVSFYYPYSINSNLVRAAMKNLINAKLIDENTPCEAFIDFFNKKDMSNNKINWIGGKSSLFSFIKCLISSKSIRYPYNSHWSITANSFTLNRSTIGRNDLSSQKHIGNKDIKQAINLFFSHFDNLETKQL